MKNLEDDIVREELAKTPDPTEKNRAEMGIKVAVKVSLDGIDNGDQIEVTFAPNIETLLPQVEKLFNQIHIRARGLMLQKLADKFNECGLSGVFPEYKYETLQAHAVISMPGGIVTIINGVEVGFMPSDVAETSIFECEKVEEAQKTLIVQLLAGFAAWGGQ